MIFHGKTFPFLPRMRLAAFDFKPNNIFIVDDIFKPFLHLFSFSRQIETFSFESSQGK
jgi:hypothetical protein